MIKNIINTSEIMGLNPITLTLYVVWYRNRKNLFLFNMVIEDVWYSQLNT